MLKKEIPENTVLSHDLLEGSYLRCGLASDIEVIDGFPSRVNSYMLRKYRWTRGDWQILKWLFKSKLNKLSKYKIFDNLRRSVLDIFLLTLIFFGNSIYTAPITITKISAEINNTFLLICNTLLLYLYIIFQI